MAIGATIAARGTDEFDIDIVAQLALPNNISPGEALDRLYDSVRGDIGSRYYKMTRRQTRCITVEYQGDMHIDITPAVRRFGTPDRESWIFHDQSNVRYGESKRLIANPYGFAEWFKARTHADDPFVSLYMARASDYEQELMAAQADAEPVPAQKPALATSKAAIALRPAFRVVQSGSRFVRWRGRLRPISQVYNVEIRYRVNRNTNKPEFGVPRVTVLEPLLRQRVEMPSAPIPHLYRNPDNPELPILCLYDPDESEWEPKLSIVKTIVPWTIDWLACYEGWLATGVWTGGGRHPN